MGREKKMDSNKDVPKSVKIDEALHLFVLEQTGPPLPKLDFSKFIRSALAFSGDIFRNNPTLVNLLLDRWYAIHAITGELVIKPFRLTAPMDRWVRQLSHDLSIDFTCLTVASIFFFLPFYRQDPELVCIVYQRWLEFQSYSCITEPRQLEMRVPKQRITPVLQ